jgi:hypothetical protein
MTGIKVFIRRDTREDSKMATRGREQKVCLLK